MAKMVTTLWGLLLMFGGALGSLGSTSTNPAVDCRNVASTDSGMYYLQSTASSTVIHTFCDLTSSDGPWMLIGHVKRGSSNFVWPGKVTAGSDPDSLGFSIKADGFHFDGIRLSHNTESDTVTKMFQQSYEYVESQKEKVYEQTDGSYSILELNNRAGSASGRIPLVLLGSTRTDGFDQSRTAASGAVSSGSGECSTMNVDSPGNSGCGGWPDGNTDWTSVGGKIFIRTSVSIDCVGSWGSYGTCSKTCSTGVQTGTFSITTAATNAGAACPVADGATHTQACNTVTCPVDCAGSWADFGTCTKTCGTGSQTRTFTVSTVAQNGGDTCPSPETQTCNTVACPVHCVGSWVDYGACSKSCDTGFQTRSYSITTFGGANGGTACPADETRACGTVACAVHCSGYWAFFDTCTKTCGTGSQTRTYTVTQQEQNGGDACPSPETQSCNTVACPVHCAGSWATYDTCSKTCGTGSQTRTYIASTSPSNGGTVCPSDETRVCGTVGCPVHCAGSWATFGTCSKTCGTGSQTRTYAILTNPSNEGTECPADETRACSTKICPIHCVGSWSGFGSCSKSCNIGSQTRTFVITTEPDHDGSPCVTIHGSLNSQQCNTYGCGEVFAYDYSLKAATHWFSPTILRLPDPAGSTVIDITIACTGIVKGPRTIVRYNQAIGGSHAEVCAKTVINFSCTGWTFTKSCGEQSTFKKIAFLDNAGGDITVTLIPDPCAFSDVTLPSGTTASGTNCHSGGSLVSGSGCTVSKGTETCQPIKCTAGAWSSTAPSCPGVCLENKDPVCTHDDMGACDSFGRRCHMDSTGGHCWKLTAGTCLSSSGSANTPFFVTSNLYEGTCGVLELKVELNPTPDSTPEDSPDSPDATQTPGGTPTPEPTASPEDTPDATNTPDPTGSPDDTPDSTPTPVPTQSPDDTAAPSPTPSLVTTYQWLWTNSSDGSDATEISGATSGSYQPTNDDAGRYLFVDVTAPGEDTVRLKSFHIGSSAACSSGSSSGVPFSTRLSSQSLRMVPRGRNRARL